MGKKGVEMSLNVIIIAAIGLLILVILAFLVINYLNNAREGLESCTAKYGGLCVNSGSCTTGTTIQNTDCSKSQKICCKTLGP